MMLIGTVTFQCNSNFDTFRFAFSHVGEVRSLVPQSVNVMALTAAATTATCKAVCRKLGMLDPVIVTQIPNRPNIHNSIVNVLANNNVEEIFAPLVDKLSQRQTLMDRTIYCRTYETCSMIYTFI